MLPRIRVDDRGRRLTLVCGRSRLELCDGPAQWICGNERQTFGPRGIAWVRWELSRTLHGKQRAALWLKPVESPARPVLEGVEWFDRRAFDRVIARSADAFGALGIRTEPLFEKLPVPRRPLCTAADRRRLVLAWTITVAAHLLVLLWFFLCQRIRLC